MNGKAIIVLKEIFSQRGLQSASPQEINCHNCISIFSEMNL